MISTRVNAKARPRNKFHIGYLKKLTTDQRSNKRDQEIDMNVSLPKIDCLAKHYDDNLSESFENSVSSHNSSKK